jgi:hypothetical protein
VIEISSKAFTMKTSPIRKEEFMVNPVRQRAALILFGASVLVVGVALAQKSFQVFVNGKATSKPAIRQGNETYIPLSTLVAAGVPVKTSGSRIEITLSAGNTTDAVAGTSQLAGGVGELGKTYTVGTQNPLNFTLKSAEFSVKRLDIGSSKFVPEVSEKLLILRFTVQNPQKKDLEFSTFNLRFTAVDSKDVNSSPEPYGSSYVAREGEFVPLKVRLKPAQKIDAYAVLIVQSSGNDQMPVVRYDLSKKVKPLPAPYNDSSDPSGATALNSITAKPGAFVPMRFSNLRLDSLAFADSFEQRAAPDGKRWLLLNLTMKHEGVTGGSDLEVGDCSFAALFTASDNETESVERCGANLYKTAREERLRSRIAPGGEVGFRMVFSVPKDVTGKSLAVTEENARTVVFDLTGLK